MTISIYKAELEKKTWEQSTDEGKKLTSRNSFCEKHSMQQKGGGGGPPKKEEKWALQNPGKKKKKGKENFSP